MVTARDVYVYACVIQRRCYVLNLYISLANSTRISRAITIKIPAVYLKFLQYI
jgi:hypothetical protein